MMTTATLTMSLGRDIENEYSHVAQLEPCLGAVDLAAEQKHGHQRGDTQYIGRVGPHVEILMVYQQQHQSHGPRYADPHQLLHVEVRHGEYVVDALVVGGCRYADQADSHQRDVQQQRNAVDAVEQPLGRGVEHAISGFSSH